jgi:hypothetical protein
MTVTLIIREKRRSLDQARVAALLGKGPVRLRHERRGVAKVLLGGLVWVGLLVWEFQSKMIGWEFFSFGASFFGLGVAIVAGQAAFPASLTIGFDGLQLGRAWQRRTIRWSEIRPFRLVVVDGDEYVGCEFVDPAKRPSWAATRGLQDVWLFHDWGFEPRDFVALLNDAKARWSERVPA